ncbi:Fc.00g061170.m01.CDS01 [Cosmosporella sp. VM-42]
MASKLLLALLLTGTVLARTDLDGCTSFATVATENNNGMPYGTVIWYVPDTGELCEFLDCGGGRAPPKTTVPGCDSYEGTETYSPNFINPKTLGQAPKTDVQTSADATVTVPKTTATKGPESKVSTTGTAASTTATVPDNLETMPTVVATESEATQETTLVMATETPSGAKTSAASQSASGDDASAASSLAPSSVSTAGGAAPTAGGMLAFAAGAAVYAGLM